MRDDTRAAPALKVHWLIGNGSDRNSARSRNWRQLTYSASSTAQLLFSQRDNELAMCAVFRHGGRMQLF